MNLPITFHHFENVLDAILNIGGGKPAKGDPGYIFSANQFL